MSVSAKNIVRVGVYKPEEVLPYVVPDKYHPNAHRYYDGRRVKMYSFRYQCFEASGLKCVICGLEGQYFGLEQFRKDQERGLQSFHFNLYAKQGEEEILFTKDHIVPASKGGADRVSNFQTMCEPCNLRKTNIMILHVTEWIDARDQENFFLDTSKFDPKKPFEQAYLKAIHAALADPDKEVELHAHGTPLEERFSSYQDTMQAWERLKVTPPCHVDASIVISIL